MSIKKHLQTLLRKPEWFFVCASLFFGIIFIILIPPFQTPDEASHFLRAYQISQLQPTPLAHNGAIGGYLPKSLSDTVMLVDTNPTIRFHADTKYNWHKTIIALKMGLDKQDTVFTPGLTTYPPLAYIPQAIAIFFASLFNSPPVLMMYLARLASLCSWTILIYAAIRVSPYKKWAFAAVALLPMFVAQAISPGIDAVSVGLGALTIAYILSIQRLKVIPRRSIVVLLILGSLIALTKPTTIAVLGLLLLLRPHQLGGDIKRFVLRIFILVAIPVLLFLGWSTLTGHLNLNGNSPIAAQDSHGQIVALLQDPLHFPGVIFNTFFTGWGDDVVRSFIGDFGWVDTPLPALFIGLGFVLIAYLLFVDYEPKNIMRLTRWKIATIGIVAGLFMLGTCLALYIFYTPVNFAIVYGLQGRYFLLILFILLPLGIGRGIKTSKKSYTMIALLGTVGLLVVSVLTIYLRYYVKLF